MKYKHLFGPVMSRRLGVSLGVDLVPYKYCPLNCVYCEVQSTTNLSVQREEFFVTKEIIDELDSFLQNKPQLDYITFSGAGEPTLNSGLGQIVSYIKENYPAYKLALLTNGVLFNDPRVRKEVMGCDIVLPSLDAASQAVFQKINRPHSALNLDVIIEGLVKFRREYMGKIWLEVFLIPGINDGETELCAMRDAIRQINPDLVQLNSLDRPGTEAWVKPLSLSAIKQVRRFFSSSLPMPVEVIAKVKYNTQANRMDEEVINLLHNTLKRRPSTAEDLSAMLDIHINEVGKVLRQLHLEGRVQVKREKRGVFYTWKE
ncbi:MAG: radical SAM protein [Candidatus Cloacimonetes bacterium HGW-Cloacimonetes-3]|jgi:wyosine [tRNA(Phe)-imidazoG37] synthetase (radical SAM superfamily)|nr:MAG: radical SAM protein [Candidatus Cloacimonetes bacterium HGW-Cloacimonetes-3]